MTEINLILFFFQDEQPETSWMLIQEDDLVALFSQFPFDAIFKHLLKMDPNIPSKLEKNLFFNSGLLKFYVANFYFKFNTSFFFIFIWIILLVFVLSIRYFKFNYKKKT